MYPLVLTFEMFNINSNLNCWSSNVKLLLEELGFSNLWNEQSITKVQVELVIQRINDQFLQTFYSSVETLAN